MKDMHPEHGLEQDHDELTFMGLVSLLMVAHMALNTQRSPPSTGSAQNGGLLLSRSC